MKGIFKEPGGYAFFPVKYQKMYEYYKLVGKTFWFEDEIDYKDDKKGFDSLTPEEQHFLRNTLSFFAASDGLVNENIILNIMKELTRQEAVAYYAFQSAIEVVHNHSYSLQINTIASNSEEELKLLNGDALNPSVKAKVDWAKKYIGCDNLSLQIAAFSLVEGLFFSTSFSSIYWLDYMKKPLPGIIQANKFIARDEALHAEVAGYVYRNYCDKVPEIILVSMVKEAVEIEKQFAREGLPVRLVGINSDDMETYIEYVADTLCDGLGISRIYGSNNPFDFMGKLGANTEINFFETRNDQYNKPTVNFGINEDF